MYTYYLLITKLKNNKNSLSTRTVFNLNKNREPHKHGCKQL